MKTAIAAAIAKGSYDAGQIDTICEQAATVASEVLYEMSGRKFSGACGPVVVRPVARPSNGDFRGSLGSMGYFSSWGSCAVAGFSSGGVVSHYGCSNPPEIELGVYPVVAVSAVKIDGVTIPSGEYKLLDSRTLVRMLATASSAPTQRYGWPTCQRLDLPDTEQGTFSVTLTYGQVPPVGGVLAATKLAEHLALPQLGDATKYPQRVTSMQRQGVSSMTVDVMDIVKTGKTGIYEVDLFLRSVNPKQLSRRGAVWSPDVGRARRY